MRTDRDDRGRAPRSTGEGRIAHRALVLVCSAVLVAGAAAAAPRAAAGQPAEGRGASFAAAAGGPTVPSAAGVALAADRARREGAHWSSCPAGWGLPAPVQCGAVTVPLDYARPFGPSLRLVVDRARSTGGRARRQGALVYDPGGPGGSGLPFPARAAASSPLWAKAAAAYDLVGFDPRGVGRSAPISCQDPREFARAPGPDPVPQDESGKRARRALARAYAAGCLRRTGAAELSQTTTVNTARDLDVIRAALGERRLTYLGASYGTYLGAVYADLFPGHVRRMVFDSAVDPSPRQIWYRGNLGQDAPFERRWRDWQAWVASWDSAYHLGATAAQVQARWQSLRAAVGTHPAGGVVGPAELLGFFQNAPYYDSAWPLVAGVWSRYEAGDTQALVDAATPGTSAGAVATSTAGPSPSGDPSPGPSVDPSPGPSADRIADPSAGLAGTPAAAAENARAAYTAVECNDAPWPASWQVWDRDATAMDIQNPFLTWENVWLNLPCATWPLPPHRPVDVRTRPGLPPVLIVQSALDPATPYRGALELHRRLGGSRLVTERGAGSHGVTAVANPCVDERVEAYLLHGSLDPHDVVCAPHDPPVPAGY